MEAKKLSHVPKVVLSNLLFFFQMLLFLFTSYSIFVSNYDIELNFKSFSMEFNHYFCQNLTFVDWKLKELKFDSDPRKFMDFESTVGTEYTEN